MHGRISAKAGEASARSPVAATLDVAQETVGLSGMPKAQVEPSRLIRSTETTTPSIGAVA
jgi:hypothetical protein